MTARYRRPVSAGDLAAREQARADKLAALHTRLTTQVQALSTGPAWQAWLAVAARFHDYSLNNILLITAQRPDARLVAGYSAWKALGRHVNAGERGIQILAPILRRTPPEPDRTAPQTDQPSDGASDPNSADPGGVPAGRRVTGYRVAHVWDISQTSGPPLPEPPRPHLLAGHAPPGLWDALAAQVTDRGFTLDRGPCGTANGRTDFTARTVTVRPDVDDAQAAKTLAHELGHILLHDPEVSDGPTGPLTAGVCRGRAEVEAESVAYLVTSSAGLDTSTYTFPYVTTWAHSADGRNPATVVTDTAQRVLLTARLIITAVPAEDPVTPAANAERLAQVSASSRQGQAAAAQLHDRATHLLAPTTTARATTTPAGRRAEPSVRVLPAAPRARLLHVNRLTAAFYTAALHSPGRDADRARDYLTARGVPPNVAERYGLGYAPRGWTALVEHLHRNGVSDAELLEVGLATPARTGGLVDRFRDRIVFPVATEPGQPLGFLGRALDPTPVRGHPVPKYLNTPETPLYRKGELLYGLDHAREAFARGATPVLVEGPLDVLAVHLASNQHAAVAPCGTALTSEQVGLLTEVGDVLADRGIVVLFDSDRAGREAALRGYPLLRHAGAWPGLASLLAGQDPGDALAKGNLDELRDRLRDAEQTPLADLVIDETLAQWGTRLQWPEGQLAACRAVAKFIADLPADQVARQVGRVAETLQLPAADVTGIVLDAVTGPAGGPPPVSALLGAQAGSRVLAGPVAVVRSAYPLPVTPGPPSHPASTRPGTDARETRTAVRSTSLSGSAR